MLLSYYFYENFVDLYYTNGQQCRVYYTEDTGAIIKRPKKGPVTQYFIDHKGMILGNLSDGTIVVLHNHIDYKCAVVDTLTGFENGIQSVYDDKQCTNTPLEMINIALEDVVNQREYDKLQWNCQIFVNKACTNEHKTDDTGRILGGVAATIGIVVVLGALLGGK